ncbi:MAG: sulfatase-like hydrolase/transferase, partial [Planctomycetia bacterium]
MKRHTHSIRLGLSITLIAAVWCGPSTAIAADRPRPPNVILILMDDMGWREVGCMGNTFAETPHIDTLARRGLLFTQAYASAPNCTPTRACLMSGLYTPRHGIYTVVDPRQPAGSPWHKLVAARSESELATEVVTVAESLRSGGYATGFFGMWNLGRGRSGPVTPGGQGFETVVFPETIQFGKDAYFDAQGNYLSDRLTDEVLAFVEKHRDRPFFAYLPDHAVHAPYDPKPELLAKYETKLVGENDGRNAPAHAATVEAVDQNIGRIMAALDRLKLTDDTLVIFTSDNGGNVHSNSGEDAKAQKRKGDDPMMRDWRKWAGDKPPTSNTPLRDGKGRLYEGGVRVPLMVRWPGRIAPASTSDAIVGCQDFYPT